VSKIYKEEIKIVCAGRRSPGEVYKALKYIKDLLMEAHQILRESLRGYPQRKK